MYTHRLTNQLKKLIVKTVILPFIDSEINRMKLLDIYEGETSPFWYAGCRAILSGIPDDEG